jgi:hypothetical protein
MIEAVIAFFALYFFSLPALIAIAVFAVWMEHIDCRAWTMLAMALVLGIAVSLYKVPYEHLLYGAIAYIAIGTIWSFWRYKRYVAEKLEKFKKIKEPRNTDKRMFVNEIDFTKMVNTIVAWIIVWPFSVIEMAISDLLDAIDTLVRTVFKRVYTAIYNSALKDADIDITEINK